MALEPTAYEEAVLEFAFGDGEMDPAFLVAETAQSAAHRTHLDRLIADVRTFKTAAGAEVTDSPAIERLRTLAVEADRVRRPAEVIDVAAERARREGRVRFIGGGALLALAAGLAIFFLMRSTPDSDPTAPENNDSVAERKDETKPFADSLELRDSRSLTQHFPESAHSFKGSGLTPPFGVGFLAASVQDLALGPDASTERNGQMESLVNRTVAGREDAASGPVPDDSAGRLALVRMGCAAVLSEAEQVPCTHGAFAYRLLRDVSLSRTEANERATSKQAAQFLKWVSASASIHADLKAQAAALLKASTSDSRAVLEGWARLLAKPSRFAE
ncbi:MAG: hypothetical protein ACI9OJ_002618 [Myxococcota bacterium]|jgi:hypothetical protein